MGARAAGQVQQAGASALGGALGTRRELRFGHTTGTAVAYHSRARSPERWLKTGTNEERMKRMKRGAVI